jgi:F0F1-type ATP synthase alpha subunit
MRENIRRGNLLRELLRQPRLARRDLFEQLIALTAVAEDWLLGLETKQVRPFVEELCRTARREQPRVVEQLATGELLEDDWQAPLAELANQMRPRYALKNL